MILYTCIGQTWLEDVEEEWEEKKQGDDDAEKVVEVEMCFSLMMKPAKTKKQQLSWGNHYRQANLLLSGDRG